MRTERLIEKAMRLHQAGEIKKAREKYQRILRKNPNDVDALHYYGVLNFQQGNAVRALELIQKALTIEPNYPDAYNNMGNVLLRLGDYEKAKLCYKNVLKLAPNRVETLNNLGLLMCRLNQPIDSLQLLKKAVELAPKSANAHYNLANTLLALGREEEAQASFKTAINIAPKFAPALMRLATFLYKKNRLDEARCIYLAWLELEPGHPVAEHMLAAISNGQAPARATAAYVSETFDEFAQGFDSQLESLGYQSPQLMAECLQGYMEAKADKQVLDAGCGTGLCGPFLKPYAKKLIGIDLSKNMLAKAANRGCYDELVHSDLIEHLMEYNQTLDLIVSTDTLVYFGDLTDVLKYMVGALKPGALCLLSVESADTPDNHNQHGKDAHHGYYLQVHGRYAHHREYLESALKAAGLHVEEVIQHDIRKELGEPVAGYLFSMVKQ